MEFGTPTGTGFDEIAAGAVERGLARVRATLKALRFPSPSPEQGMDFVVVLCISLKVYVEKAALDDAFVQRRTSWSRPLGKSTRLRLADVRRVFGLLGDCRELGRDRAAWSARAVAGLREEFGAYLAIVGHIDDSLVEAVQPGKTLFEEGWESEHDRQRWGELVVSGRVEAHDTVKAFYGEPPASVVVRSRDQLVPDHRWSRSTERNEDRMPLHQDETLIGQLSLDSPCRHLLISINRGVGDRGFNARERSALDLFLQEVRELAGSKLSMDAAGPLADLSPRAREVLNALLEGDSEKQVAVRLGVSRHTVHDYVKSLYRRFDVASRAELLATIHRLGRPL